MPAARQKPGWGFKRIALLSIEVLLILLTLALILATIFPAIYIARE